jgi:hypothetical protein
MKLSPEQMADKLVYDYYHTTEHWLNDEYSRVDWKVAAVLATKQIDGILDFMKQDDDLHESCHYANSPWAKYWLDVVMCIKEEFMDNK